MVDMDKEKAFFNFRQKLPDYNILKKELIDEIENQKDHIYDKAKNLREQVEETLEARLQKAIDVIKQYEGFDRYRETVTDFKDLADKYMECAKKGRDEECDIFRKELFSRRIEKIKEKFSNVRDH